jgi:hypothetical protein
MASLNATTSSGIVATADNTGQLQLQSAGTTVVTITSTGETVTGTGSFSGNLSFNSGYGSAAVAYGCRAWVSFNGTGTVAIRGSGNVSSITDNGTGNYTINFSTAMPDANYSFVGGLSEQNWGGKINTYTTPRTNGVDIYTFEGDAAARFDPPWVFASIFR